MKFIFSKHALEQMHLRGISQAEVKKILAKPEQIIAQGGKRIYQSIVIHGGKNFLIRIFVNPKKKPVVVITVYKTSKVEKYYEG